jgi:hypothetical protein
MFKENISSRTVSVELHDCDEYMADEEEATFSYGAAKFSLKDLLKPHVKHLKLRSDVFPVKR